MNEAQPIRTKKDVNKMLASLHGRNRLMLQAGIGLGLRITDLLSLKIGDVRGRTEFTIHEGKTQKRRRMKISATLREEFDKLDGEDDEYIFRSRQGGNKPIGRTQAYNILNDAGERAGLVIRGAAPEGKKKGPIISGAISCHSLRKSYGWFLYEKGTDITRIQHMLNHSSPQTTLAYIGIHNAEIDEAYESLDDIIS
ncbi:tyrosine-type recombinase/integrase [Shouchella miscanthi]|uniref:Tyrosine-type recombinase/integrase n=1 Tax=Shouchella miscanthi TaxID=2598861 RepID=A0ABU6NMQ9_9BACI|nr:tyrosine-type recombinase/integrase [Shouchella miscanthi]MED4129483.1 tyrosine-type recombinase/integrase [Shouchella miscanthi]